MGKRKKKNKPKKYKATVIPPPMDPPVDVPAGSLLNPEADPNWDALQQIKDRKSTRLNSSHSQQSRMPSSA